MKKFLFLISMVFAVATIILSPDARGDNQTRTHLVTMTKQMIQHYDSLEEFETEGRRMPSRPVQCVISPEGIHIAGIDTTSISLYEVYDADGELLAAYTAQSDFISCIFQIQEEVEIRFHTADAILSGWLLP